MHCDDGKKMTTNETSCLGETNERPKHMCAELSEGMVADFIAFALNPAD